MTRLVEELIAFHADLGVDGVSDDRGFIQLCEARRGDSGFNRMLNDVGDVASQLEGALRAQTHQEQVSLALRMFNSLRREPEKQEVCGALARRRYSPNWSDDQQRYFDEAADRLSTWRDYFLSFTNHNPTKDQVLLVNIEYRRVISEGLGRKIGPPETKQSNLLAGLLQYRLKNQPLSGFFYPEHREPDEVIARLEEEPRQSFAFVQLLQRSMFEKWPNYCQIEFDAAICDDARDLIFVMPGLRNEFIAKEVVDNRMHDWYDVIMDRDIVELAPASTPTAARAVLDQIQERVVRQVESARRRVFEQVPP